MRHNLGVTDHVNHLNYACAKCNGNVNSLLKKHVSTRNSSFYVYRIIYLKASEVGGPIALYFCAK